MTSEKTRTFTQFIAPAWIGLLWFGILAAGMALYAAIFVLLGLLLEAVAPSLESLAFIGFFAPFPRMWVQRGSSGLANRLLSGAETLLMYFLYAAAALCVWRNRRRVEVWLLFLVATIGTIALGMVVMNAGALYRLRYVFWIMFIIMAADALVHFTILRTRATKS